MMSFRVLMMRLVLVLQLLLSLDSVSANDDWNPDINLCDSEVDAKDLNATQNGISLADCKSFVQACIGKEDHQLIPDLEGFLSTCSQLRNGRPYCISYQGAEYSEDITNYCDGSFSLYTPDESWCIVQLVSKGTIWTVMGVTALFYFVVSLIVIQVEVINRVLDMVGGIKGNLRKPEKIELGSDRIAWLKFIKALLSTKDEEENLFFARQKSLSESEEMERDSNDRYHDEEDEAPEQLLKDEEMARWSQRAILKSTYATMRQSETETETDFRYYLKASANLATTDRLHKSVKMSSLLLQQEREFHVKESDAIETFQSRLDGSMSLPLLLSHVDSSFLRPVKISLYEKWPALESDFANSLLSLAKFLLHSFVYYLDLAKDAYLVFGLLLEQHVRYGYSDQAFYALLVIVLMFSAVLLDNLRNVWRQPGLTRLQRLGLSVSLFFPPAYAFFKEYRSARRWFMLQKNLRKEIRTTVDVTNPYVALDAQLRKTVKEEEEHQRWEELSHRFFVTELFWEKIPSFFIILGLWIIVELSEQRSEETHFVNKVYKNDNDFLKLVLISFGSIVYGMLKLAWITKHDQYWGIVGKGLYFLVVLIGCFQALVSLSCLLICITLLTHLGNNLVFLLGLLLCLLAPLFLLSGLITLYGHQDLTLRQRVIKTMSLTFSVSLYDPFKDLAALADSWRRVRAQILLAHLSTNGLRLAVVGAVYAWAAGSGSEGAESFLQLLQSWQVWPMLVAGAFASCVQMALIYVFYRFAHPTKLFLNERVFAPTSHVIEAGSG